MRCQCCNKEVAKIQIRDIDNWNITSVRVICEGCASFVLTKLLNPTEPLPSAEQAVAAGQAELAEIGAVDMDALKGVLDSMEQHDDESDDDDESSDVIPTLTCESCGTTFKEFQKVGRLGCPACYESFAEHMDQILEHIHGVVPTEHPGRGPGAVDTDSRASQRREIQRLSQQMQSAVSSEHYERAAQLRDQIREMEERLSSGRQPVAEGDGSSAAS